MDMELTFRTPEVVDFLYINKFLNIPEEVDIEYSGDLDVSYELQPDVTSFGLNGIDVSIRSVYGTIEWETSEEFLSPDERLMVIAAGGTLMNNGYYQGSFDLNVTEADEDWTFVNNTDFASNGSFYFDGVEVDPVKKIITL